METNNKFILRTGFILANSDANLKEASKENGGFPSVFDLEGTEEEIFKRINTQLCIVFAMYYGQFKSKNHEEEMIRLKDKFLIK